MLLRNSIFVLLTVFLLLTSASGEEAKSSSDNFIIKFYQNYISPVDGDRCPMHPSCSQYAAKAIKKHGLVKGWVMACDRLVRCGRDTCRIVPVIVINEEKYYHDPVEANDFWWFQDSKKKPARGLD